MENKNTVEVKQNFANLIENKFSITLHPQITKVNLNDGSVHIGYFQHFNDYDSLKANFQFRFIPMQKMIEHSENPDKNNSIIISTEDVESITEETLPGITK